MDFISGPQDDGSADELCRIDRRDFSHRRLTTCTWCRGYIWHDPPRGDIFYVLIWIYIYLFFVLKFLWLRPCQWETFHKTFNHQVFDSGGIIKNCIKKTMMLLTHPTFRRLVIGRKTSFYLHRLLTLSDFWDKLLFEISILCYFTRSSNFFAYIIFLCDRRQFYYSASIYHK